MMMTYIRFIRRVTLEVCTHSDADCNRIETRTFFAGEVRRIIPSVDDMTGEESTVFELAGIGHAEIPNDAVDGPRPAELCLN